METSMLEGFNPGQKAAVEYCDGPSLVIAGAGSGKTRVLTYKVAYLIKQLGYKPWSILALTFTNKAANEMKARIAAQVGNELARYVWMGTFHSVFLRILRVEHEAIGFGNNFTVYDTADSKSLLKAIIKEMQLDDKLYKPGDVLNRISNAKNQLVDAQEYKNNPSNLQLDARERMPKFAEVFVRYEERCRSAQAMDFDDILLYTYRLFDQHPDVLDRYEQRFRYILVDEYQDTNFAQHRIVWQLSQKHQHVCVVGDDAQSIYSFRGANIDNILTFRNLYQDVRLFKLEQNYRSTQTIVNAANSLIAKNSRQIHKEVFSDKEAGDKLHLFEAYSDKQEGEIVVRCIKDIIRKEKCAYSDFAILYRTNAQSRIFEDELRLNNLPYKIYGGLSFYQRKEIKDIIAYFRLAVNPNDEEALKRVINYPARGIGNTTLNKIVETANRNRVSLWDVLLHPDKLGLSVSGATLTRLIKFRDMILHFQQMAENDAADKAGVAIVKESGIINDIYQDSSPENLSRQENVNELVNGLDDFVQSRQEEDNHNVSISDYLSEVSLLSEVDTDKGDSEEKITLMTVHSAKGLEFNTVFVVGLEENLFPSQMGSGSLREMEEERRLFYVAITRAKAHCFLTYAKSRYRYGKMEFGNPSRFLRDIDRCYIESGKGNAKPVNRDVELPWVRKSSTDVFSSYRTTQAPSTSRPTSPSSASSRPSSYSPTSSSRPSSSSSSSSQASPSAPPANLQCGTRIRHDRFGLGNIIAVSGSGDGMKVTVQFDNAGQKVLLVKYARLTVVG
ncbi:MAG: UvrD-helicase domain-containing protein [Bacteroidaceae bacterium]|nr:UvrD-helicase domain-containing protein [Bacteroidaceae bacterium]